MAKTKRRKVSAKSRRERTNKQLYRLIFLLLGLVVAMGIYRACGKQDDRFHTFEDFRQYRKYPVWGVDVSHHNARIDWQTLYDENVSFVYLKSTEGVSHRDRNYKKHYAAAKKAGLKVGTYHFFSFTLDGNRQARHFIKNSKVTSKDMIPAIDVEHSTFNLPCEDEKCREKTVKELKKLETAILDHYGKRALIYTNKDGYKLYIKNNFPENPLWICDLHNEPGSEYKDWVIWQFSHTGKVNGAVNDIDLNYFRYAPEDFEKLLMP